MENGDYDSNYDDESSDYTDDYQASGLATGSSGLPHGSEATSTSEKELEEILAALRKVEVKRGQDLEKCIRESIDISGKEKPLEEEKDEVTRIPLTIQNLTNTKNISDAKQKRSVLERNFDSQFLNGDEIHHFSKNDNRNKTKNGKHKIKPKLKEDKKIENEPT